MIRIVNSAVSGRFRIARCMILSFAWSLLLVATSVSLYSQETADQVRIGVLEKGSGEISDHERRITRLEDALASLHEDMAESKWWSRLVSSALLAAVTERILRTIGWVGKSDSKTDGMGPVG